MRSGKYVSEQSGKGLAVRYWIESALRERMAAAETAEGHDATPQDSKALHGHVGILRTRWQIDASGATEAVQHGGEEISIYREYEAE
jgi:hypothetical protein